MKLINLYNIEWPNGGPLKYSKVFTINPFWVAKIEDKRQDFSFTFNVGGKFEEYVNNRKLTRELLLDWDGYQIEQSIKEKVTRNLVQNPCLSMRELSSLRFYKISELPSLRVGFIRVVFVIQGSEIRMYDGNYYTTAMPREEVVRLCNESKGNNEIPQLITEYSEKLTPEQNKRMRQLGYSEYPIHDYE